MEFGGANSMGIFSVFNTQSVPGIMVTNWDSVATAQSVSKASGEQ